MEIKFKNLLVNMHIPSLVDDLLFSALFGDRNNDRNRVQLSPQGERYFTQVVYDNYYGKIPKCKKVPWVYYFNNMQTQFSSINQMKSELKVSIEDIAFSMDKFIPTFRHFLREGAEMRSAFNGEMFPLTLVFLLHLDRKIIKVEAEYYSPSGYWNIYESVLDEHVDENKYAGEEVIGVQEKGFILNSPPQGILSR